MRLALILSSNYSKTPRYLAQPGCVVDANLMEDCLSEPELGFQVQRVALRRRLEARITRALAGEPEGPTLFYFSGYGALQDGEARLVLDDPKGGVLSVKKLLPALASRPGGAWVILELLFRPGKKADEARVLAEGERLVAAALAELEASAPSRADLSLMVAARRADAAASGPSPATRLLLLALEQLNARNEAVNSEAIFREMKADPAFSGASAVGFSLRGQPFELSERASRPQASASASPEPPPDTPAERAIEEEPAPKSRMGKPPPKPKSLPGSALAASSALSGSAPASEAMRSEPGSQAAPLSVSAQELLDERDFEGALSAYKKQLLKLGGKRGPEHAAVYVGMGRAKAGQGKLMEALHNYDKALAILPTDNEIFAEAKQLVLGSGDVDRLAEWIKGRAEGAAEPRHKAFTLLELGRLWLQYQNAHRAIAAFEAATAADASYVDAHLELAATFTELERFPQAIRALSNAAEAELEDKKRAEIWIRAAKIAQLAYQGGEEALQLASRALIIDPKALEALEILSQVLAERRRFLELAEVYEQALEGTQPGPLAFELSKRLGLVYRDELDDLDGARRCFLRAIESDPSELSLYYFVSELYEAQKDYQGAAEVFQRAALYHPEQPEVYRRALWLFEKMGRLDAAWNSAMALESLGEADINESLLADQHRPEGAIMPQSRLDASGVTARLLDFGALFATPHLDIFLEALEPIVLRFAAQQPVVKGLLEGAVKQDPESTASLVRSLGWACRLLSLDQPRLWLRTDWQVRFGAEVGVLLLPAERASAGLDIIASQKLGSGFTPAELAYVWGAALAASQHPFRLLEAFASDVELGRLVLSGLAIAEVEGVELDQAGQKLKQALLEQSTPDELSALKQAVEGLAVRDMGRQLGQWRRRVALARGRLGLLLCGDLSQAEQLLERLAPPLVELSQLRNQLRAFSISEAYLSLRSELGIALTDE